MKALKTSAIVLSAASSLNWTDCTAVQKLNASLLDSGIPCLIVVVDGGRSPTVLTPRPADTAGSPMLSPVKETKKCQ